MYAIVEASGRQWKVEPGTRLDVNRVSEAVGGFHTLDRVLLAHDGTQLQVGRPVVAGAQVVCEVVDHRLGPKVISYHFRRRENWRKTVGHRQQLTRLLVKDIVLAGQPAASRAKAEPVHQEVAAKAPVKPRAQKAAATKASAAADAVVAAAPKRSVVNPAPRLPVVRGEGISHGA